MKRALIGAPRNHRGQLTRTEKNMTLDALQRANTPPPAWVSHAELSKHTRIEKRILLKALTLGLIAFPLLAQVQPSPALTLTPDKTSYLPGATALLTVTLSGSANASLGAVAFDISGTGITFDAANITLAGAQPGKGFIAYNRTPQDLFVVVIGDAGGALNNLPLVDGALVSIMAVVGTPQAPGVLNVALTQSDGASTAAPTVDVPVTGTGVSFTIVASPCDVNHDGKIDFHDVDAAALALAQNQPGTIAWALSLTNVYRVLQAAIGGACTL